MEQLTEDLKNADHSNNALFASLVIRVQETLNLPDVDLAFRFSASRPTIARWKDGVNAPHPAMRGAIYGHFIALLEAKRDTGADPTPSY